MFATIPKKAVDAERMTGLLRAVNIIPNNKLIEETLEVFKKGPEKIEYKHGALEKMIFVSSSMIALLSSKDFDRGFDALNTEENAEKIEDTIPYLAAFGFLALSGRLIKIRDRDGEGFRKSIDAVLDVLEANKVPAILERFSGLSFLNVGQIYIPTMSLIVALGKVLEEENISRIFKMLGLSPDRVFERYYLIGYGSFFSSL